MTLNANMLKRERVLLISVMIILSFAQILFISNDSDLNYLTHDEIKDPRYSASVEGIENIIITKIIRIANISRCGLVNFEDYITFKNLNNNPITSIFIGIPLNYSDDLVYYAATGIDKNTLLIERSHLIMEDFEIITIYLDSPLLPYQTKSVIFNHHYKNLVTYHIEYTPEGTPNQYHTFNGFVYPTLPYKLEKEVDARFFVPRRMGDLEGGWGWEDPEKLNVRYQFSSIEDEFKDEFIAPFLENLNNKKIINISFFHNEFTRLDVEEINREIYISPWGIIEVKEDYTIKNFGAIDLNSFTLNLPRSARKIYVSDNFGEIPFSKTEGNLKYKEITIKLIENRVKLTPNSSFTFNLRYFLPFENYYSMNWIQESIEIDLLTSNFEYLGRQQIIKIIIDGCYRIDSISEPPESIEKANGATVLIYSSNYVSPLETKFIQFTFTLDLFDLLLRPIIILLLISIILTSYVLVVKLRKKGTESPLLKKEYIPVNEIREFCSLHEEKNALILEIRQAEEDSKRKKIAKKNYKNILNKNTSKIDEIQKEIVPFKKTLIETSETFENIVKKLDILEAEQISIKDSLNLLEARYKRGRLPSRAAYLKLSDDFNKRRRKIDRTIDKFIQQLRSYLL